MATWDESYLDLMEYDRSSIVRIQAVCRGWLSRKTLKIAQTNFLDIVAELDGPAMEVEWSDVKLPVPVVHKVHKKSRVSKTKTQRHQPASDYQQRQENGADENKNVGRLTEVNPNKMEQCCGTEIKNSSQELSNAQDTVETGSIKSSQQEDNSDPVRYGDHAGTDIQESNMEKVHHDPIDTSKVENAAVTRPRSTSRSSVSSTETNIQTTRPTSVHSTSFVTLEPAPEISRPLRRVDSFFGEQTSVWDSNSTLAHDSQTVPTKEADLLPGHERASAAQHNSQEGDIAVSVSETEMRFLGTEELVRQRQNIAMELLWVQQAIISRKQYLKLRTQMEVAS